MIWLFVLWFIAMIVGLVLIVFIFISGVKNFEKNKEKKKRKQRINCIKKTIGTIIEIKQNDALILKVQYQVDNNIYHFEEKALLAIEKIEWRGITVGKKRHYPFDIHIGSVVDIKYDPKNPCHAYIVENTGIYRKSKL